MSEILSKLYQGGKLKPKIDYYYGRPCEGNTLNKNGLEIKLAGDVVIKTEDTDFNVVDDELKGYSLGTAILSAGATRLRFVRQWDRRKMQYEEQTEVALDPNNYSIIDPAFNEGEEHFPQRAEKRQEAPGDDETAEAGKTDSEDEDGA